MDPGLYGLCQLGTKAAILEPEDIVQVVSLLLLLLLFRLAVAWL